MQHRVPLVQTHKISTKLEERGRWEEGSARNLPWETALHEHTLLQEGGPRTAVLPEGPDTHPAHRCTNPRSRTPTLQPRMEPAARCSAPARSALWQEETWEPGCQLHALPAGCSCASPGALPPCSVCTERSKALQKRTRNTAVLGRAPALAGTLRHALCLGGDGSPLGR